MSNPNCIEIYADSGPIELAINENKSICVSFETCLPNSQDNELQLGETSTTAYRGDRGKIAYDHSQKPHAPANAQHNVQADYTETDVNADSYIKNKPAAAPHNAATGGDGISVTVAQVVSNTDKGSSAVSAHNLVYDHTLIASALQTGDNVSELVNDAGYLTSSADEKVKYNAADAAAGYLGAKTVPGTGISLSEGTGADADKLKITNSDTGSSAVSAHNLAFTHANIHAQNTDTGTTNNTFTVDSDSNTGKIIVDVALGAADKSLTITNEALTGDHIATFQNKTGTVALTSDIIADTDEKVKYNAGDPTAGYVADKIVAGSGISVSEGAGPTENKLEITNNDTGSGAVGTHEGTYDHTLIATALQDISGQDLSTADNSTSQFITLGDIPAETDPVVGAINGIVKANGSGVISAASAGTDYQAPLTFGIADTNKVQIDSATVANGEFAKFTATGLESRTGAEVLSDIGAQAALTKATSSEINTGTDDAKYITSLGMKGSKYARKSFVIAMS